MSEKSGPSSLVCPGDRDPPQELGARPSEKSDDDARYCWYRAAFAEAAAAASAAAPPCPEGWYPAGPPAYAPAYAPPPWGVTNPGFGYAPYPCAPYG
jgi:hypothetical protein